MTHRTLAGVSAAAASRKMKAAETLNQAPTVPHKNRQSSAGMARICVIRVDSVCQNSSLSGMPHVTGSLLVLCFPSFSVIRCADFCTCQSRYPSGYPFDRSPCRQCFPGLFGETRLTRNRRSGTLIIPSSGWIICQIAHSFTVSSVFISVFPPAGSLRRESGWSSSLRLPG